MSGTSDRIALWLADNLHLSTMLLAGALILFRFLKQPVRRLVVAKATIMAMLLLAVLVALPGWSIIHLHIFEDHALPHAAATPSSSSSLAVAPPLIAARSATPENLASSTEIRKSSINLPAFTWPQIIVGIYATGATAVFAWLVLGMFAAARLVRASQPAPASLHHLATELAPRDLPILHVSNHIAVPVALGLTRPTIILPSSWLSDHNSPPLQGGAMGGLSPNELRIILAHELAHIQSGDLRWLAVSRALLILLWPQPLYWLLCRQMRLDQESLADAAAADLTDRHEYAEHLVAWARALPSDTRPTLTAAVGLWESPSQLRRRIALLLNDRLTILRQCPRPWRLTTTVMALIAAAALSLITLQPSSHGETTAEQPNQLPKQLHPIFADSPAPGSTTRDVAPTELAGRVIDEQGRPLEGVNVDAWTWYPGNETTSDADGNFTLTGFQERKPVEVEFRASGFCPALFVGQPAGTANWNVTLNSRTYLQGTVTGPDGKTIAGARVRAARGPFRTHGVVIDQVWTEIDTDLAGRYRLYVQPDTYDVQVHVPSVGLARFEHVVVHDGDQQRFDIALKQGPVFRAHIVDSQSNDPVAGIKLWNWQHEGIEGTADANGDLVIENMVPGEFEFQVSATGENVPTSFVAGKYARWWSPDAIKPWEKLDLTDRGSGFQRNFDRLTFDIRDRMSPVSIVVEKCVTINGHVIDPDGKFVGGATVAPARTGWDNTITGDTRFNVRTADDGSFSIRLPASGGTTYNLLAHDGDYDQWRNWANGVGQPLQTKPGDNLQDVELRLSRPCIVRGRVIDSRGKPVANRSVRTQAPDKDENRYYDTTTSTNEKGEFELRFVRAGEQYVQVEPFDVAERAPRQTWKLVTATPDHSVEDVLLTTEYELVSEPTPYFRSILLPGHEKPALIEKPGAPESSSSDKPVAPSGPTIESQSATKLRHKQSKEDDPSSRDGEGNSTKPWRVYTPFEVPAGSK